MANEETSRTAEATDGSMKSIMTTANELGPEPSGSHSLWAKVKPHIDLASKLVPIAWSVFLLYGGLLFLAYFNSISFIPELDLKASITLLAVSAITGGFLLIGLVMTLIGPAWLWIVCWGSTAINHESAKLQWYNRVRWLWYKPEFSRWRAMLYFELPLAGFMAGVLLWSLIGKWWGIATGLTFLGLTVVLVWKTLGSDVDWKQRLTTTGVFIGSLLPSMMVFLSLTIVLAALIKTSPPDSFKQTLVEQGTLATLFFVLGWFIILIINTGLVGNALHNSTSFFPSFFNAHGLTGIALLILLSLWRLTVGHLSQGW
jgi:hypothetical protein